MGPELKPLETEGGKKRTFKRRIGGLKKKIFEFSILCDVDACFICFEDNSSLQKPAIWPENSSELERIISRYAKLGKKDQKCKNLDLPSGMSETEKESKRKRREICSSSYPTWDDDLNGLSEASLIDLVRALDSKIDSVKNRIGVLKKQKQSTQNHHPTWDDVLNGISEASLRDLVRALDSKIDSVKNTIRVSEKQGQSTQNHHPVLSTIPLVTENQPLPISFLKPFNNHLTSILVSNVMGM